MGTTDSAATVVPLVDSQKKERRKKKGYLFCQNYLFFSIRPITRIAAGLL